MKLRPYQDEAVDFLFENDRAMVLAPVGAGKTAITLKAMEGMILEGYVTRWLVIAPLRVARDVWPIEQVKWSSEHGLQLADDVEQRLQQASQRLLDSLDALRADQQRLNSSFKQAAPVPFSTVRCSV